MYSKRYLNNFIAGKKFIKSRFFIFKLFIFKLFILIFSIHIIPGYAAAPIYVHNNTSENCNACHFDEQAASFQHEQRKSVV